MKVPVSVNCEKGSSEFAIYIYFPAPAYPITCFSLASK